MRASFTVDPAFTVAPVNRRTFGAFVEHLGRCVYTGIYEPGHPTADDDGFRADVLELTRELGVSVVRYPGGNFVSNYRWEDGIGPRDERPRRLDLAWHSIETNEFGLDEFICWCAKAGVEPMLAVNLGTRGVAEAIDLIEYTNIPGGTALSELRVRNGAKDPYNVRMWCLGNEMDGPWQVGHKTAHEYGRLAAETARAMRMVTADLELVVCGSSSRSMPTFAGWEAEVLEQAYDQVDYISCHAYYEELDGDLGSFLASATDLDRYIDAVVATADHVGAKLRSPKRINVSFDEWNVWYLERHRAEPPAAEWRVAPRIIENDYSAADAVVVGSLLIALLRHSDRVTAAAIAQLVNVIAPIRTEPNGPAWRQTTFYPFALTSRHAAGEVLRVEPSVSTYKTAKYGDVSLVDAVATRDAEAGETTIFVVNRSIDRPVPLDVDIRALNPCTPVKALTVTDADPYATNNQQRHDRVTPSPLPAVTVDSGVLSAVLPPVSWSMLVLAAESPKAART